MGGVSDAPPSNRAVLSQFTEKMMFRAAAVVLLSTVVVQADILEGVKGVGSDVGNFFTSQFNNVKDLFGNSQSDLESNINRVKDLLTGVKEKIKVLEPMANDAQKETLKNVDGFLSKVTSFQNDVVKEGQAQFEQNKGKWQTMVTDIFEKGGLQNVLKLLNMDVKSASSFTCAAAVLPIAYMLIR